MKYLNQLEYPHIPYFHPTDTPGGTRGADKTVATSGCGLCAVAMAVDLLTGETVELEESVKWALECGANHGAGTDMTLYGPVIAEKFRLSYEETEELETVVTHLQKGGQVVARVHGDGEDAVGLFSHRGHFICLIGIEDDEFCILDPSYTLDKFTLPERAGRVRTEKAPYLYCKKEDLHADRAKEVVPYYLFAKK